jgi:hypothetical protein
MKRAFLVMLAAVFAFIPQAYAQEYKEFTEVGGEPETKLTVKVPVPLPGEEFTIEATVLTTEEGKEYYGRIESYIYVGYDIEKSEASPESSKEDLLEEVEELEFEEIEEACEAGEPIELDGYRIYFNCQDEEKFLKVTSEEKTFELTLVAPPPIPSQSTGIMGAIGIRVENLETDKTTTSIYVRYYPAK